MTRLIAVHPDQTLQIIVPSVTEPVTTINSDDVLYFLDFFKKDILDQVINQYGKPLCVITSAEGCPDQLSVPCYYIPIFPIEFQAKDFRNNIVFDKDEVAVTHCFNFSIGKQRPERHLLLKLIEWFGLTSYQYTWSEHKREFNMSHFINEMAVIDKPWMTNDLKIHMLSPIKQFEQRWVHNHKPFLVEQTNTMFTGGGIDFWWTEVQNNIIPQTATTLLTESVTDFESNFTFTEKTLFAIVGLTFPIWVGSYKQAEQAERMGFDIFSDVIDHSYQHCDTMFERCYRAIADNIELLTNLDLARDSKNNHRDRLLKNREFALNGGLSSWIDTQMALLPPNIIDFYTTNYQRNVK